MDKCRRGYKRVTWRDIFLGRTMILLYTVTLAKETSYPSNCIGETQATTSMRMIKQIAKATMKPNLLTVSENPQIKL